MFTNRVWCSFSRTFGHLMSMKISPPPIQPPSKAPPRPVSPLMPSSSGSVGGGSRSRPSVTSSSIKVSLCSFSTFSSPTRLRKKPPLFPQNTPLRRFFNDSLLTVLCVGLYGRSELVVAVPEGETSESEDRFADLRDRSESNLRMCGRLAGGEMDDSIVGARLVRERRLASGCMFGVLGVGLERREGVPCCGVIVGPLRGTLPCPFKGLPEKWREREWLEVGCERSGFGESEG